jgi:acylphosphatase
MDRGVEFRVSGRVQGVAFRAFVQRTARQMDLTGWVQNNSDGSVSGYAEGDQGMLIELIKQLGVGNRWSNVSAVEEHQKPFTGDFEKFEIRY